MDLTSRLFLIPSNEVYELGTGASVVHLMGENKHITLRGSSRMINGLFEEIVDEEEHETPKVQTELIETVKESVIVGPMGPEGPTGSSRHTWQGW